MSDSTGSCEYVLDPDDPETWGGDEGAECYVEKKHLNEDGVWTCPHETEEGEDLCIFHRPVAEKDDAEVSAAFVDVLDDGTERDNSSSEYRRFPFLGARFGEFDLSEDPPEIVAEDAEIILSHATIEGELNWYGAVFDVSTIVLSGIECLEDATFSSADFGGSAVFGAAEFEKEISFISTEFGESAHFDETKFGGRTTFDSAAFEHVSFRAVEFGSSASFMHVGFGEVVLFADAEFGDSAYFRSATFEGDAEFANADFEESADLRSTEFEERAGFLGTEFGAGVNFRFAEFGGSTCFLDVGFGSHPVFSDATFDEGPDFSSIESLADGKFNGADLTGASFDTVVLHDADFEDALLSRATLFGADFRGAKLNGAVLGDVRIDEDTRFLGHPDDDGNISPHTFSAMRSKPCCVYDPNYKRGDDETDVDQAKSVYRALEELAGKAARPRLQSQCFVRRQDLQKDGYKRDLIETESWQERLIAGARYSRAKVARGTLLYGESPWRIIGGSLGFILLVSLLYPLGEWLRPVGAEPITYGRILGGEWSLLLEPLYFSTLTFTTLGMGDYQPMGFGQVLATLNTALGAVLIALLVFVLGRRAAR